MTMTNDNCIILVPEARQNVQIGQFYCTMYKYIYLCTMYNLKFT